MNKVGKDDMPEYLPSLEDILLGRQFRAMTVIILMECCLKNFHS